MCKKTWYDDLVRKGKCDACKKIKPLQWDTKEDHFCHDCMCHSEKAFEVFLNHFELYGGDESVNGVMRELFPSEWEMLKKKNGDNL